MLRCFLKFFNRCIEIENGCNEQTFKTRFALFFKFIPGKPVKKKTL
jgi:hypothetical protein